MAVKLTTSDRVKLHSRPNMVYVVFECGQRRAFKPEEMISLANCMLAAAEDAVRQGREITSDKLHLIEA